MTYIVLPVVIVFFASLAIFHFKLLGSGRWPLSERQWEMVDYLWYGLGFVALLIGGFQILAAIERNRHYEEIRSIQSRYFEIEKAAQAASKDSCPKETSQCQLLQVITQAIQETQFTDSWPLGPVRYRGKIFDSLNRLIFEQSQEIGVTKIDGRVGLLSTALLDSVGRARESERNLRQLTPPLWIIMAMPYLLAITIALRITKVTFKVRQKKGN